MAKLGLDGRFFSWHGLSVIVNRQTKLETHLKPTKLLTSSAGRANPALWLLKNLILLSIPVLATAQQQVHPPKRPYDVLSYRVQLDWRPVFAVHQQIFSGENTIVISLAGDVSTIVLDAAEMRIDSVRVNGNLLSVTPQPIADTVAIPLASVPKDGRVTLEIGYTRSRASNDGFYFYPRGTTDGPGIGARDTTLEDVAYTMSEPLDAHKWMPCNDYPNDKANSEMLITVPSGYSAQSNGTLQSVVTNPDGSVTFDWVGDRPISTYLMAASATKYFEWRDYYHRVSNPNDSVPVIYYAWKGDYDNPDTNGGRYCPRFGFRNTVKMLENDSRLFGEYPFAKYGQVPVQPFAFGGMEHQSITMLGRGELNGTQGSEDVIAHELFHQWFGDKTTCETWADIWLNEGFATYGESIWEEAIRGKAGYDEHIAVTRWIFFKYPVYLPGRFVNNVPIYNPPVDGMFGMNEVTVYHKPGLMLHMLRRVLNNDTLFFNSIRDYSSTFAYTSANTFQFRDYMVQRIGARSPIDLFEFFNQWLFRPDWPIYTMAWSQDASNKLLIRVQQAPDSSDHYLMPLRFKAVHGTDTTDLTFINNARTQFFTQQLDHPIDTLMFDELSVPVSTDTLFRDQRLSVGAVAANSESALRIYEDGSATKCSFARIVTPEATMRVLDVLGRVVWEAGISAGSTVLTIPQRAFITGDYFAVLRDGTRQSSVRFQIRK